MVVKLVRTAQRSSAHCAPVATVAANVHSETSLTQSSAFHGALGPGEIWWRDQGVWLEERGYKLRMRYRLDWKPSWEGKRKQFWYCEDGLPLLYSQFMDAIRVQDNAMVGLKKISLMTSKHEVEFAESILPSLPQEERNHCVPILDVLRVPDGGTVILVMPFLRPFYSPPFQSVSEVVDFCHQVLEVPTHISFPIELSHIPQGLDFMHDHHIAHRFHPASPDKDAALKKKAKHYTRTQRPVKYYFIDFGISEQYLLAPEKNGVPSALAPVHVGGDRTVPEFQGSATTHDPFPADVYYVGNLLREYILEKYCGLEPLEPLIHDMVQADPTARPSTKKVMERFNQLRADKASPLRSKHKRIVPKGETLITGLFKDIRYTLQTVVRTGRRFLLFALFTSDYNPPRYCAPVPRSCLICASRYSSSPEVNSTFANGIIRRIHCG
ncbi:hypothetical protein NM688_g1939 [Phlebia brevispora]|uniref:Uncharacterized protein n=1 Tax=Phlebia brevispora TaxID=194682 RepID=A0ACC1T9X0_9APHY|nr:hypothetical protein NM688_g1939 [Phlebia brevispora]